MAGTVDISNRVRTAPKPLSVIRHRRTRIHCIINEVATTLTANVLLAAGAVPTMSDNSVEVADFTRSADALSINLGMLKDSRREAIQISTAVANDSGMPWVLDPAFVDRSTSRLDFCVEMLDQRPGVVRGNASEIDAICTRMNLSRQQLSSRYSSLVMVTGNTDQLIWNERVEEVTQGHEWMAGVTGMGCALTALTAAFLAVIDDPFDAAMQALRMYGTIGEAAAERASGPGSFIVHFLDALDAESRR